MKKFLVMLGLLLLWSISYGAVVGKMFFDEKVQKAVFGEVKDVSEFPFKVLDLNPDDYKSFFDEQKNLENLRMLKVQKDERFNMMHYRYQQYFKGLPVMGGQVIYHFKGDEFSFLNGNWYVIENFSIEPNLRADEPIPVIIEAIREKYNVNEDELKLIKEPSLIIYPLNDDDIRLAYIISIETDSLNTWTGYVDAKNGEILSFSSNRIEKDTFKFGVGKGYHDLPHILPLVESSADGNLYAKVGPQWNSFFGAEYYLILADGKTWPLPGKNYKDIINKYNYRNSSINFPKHKGNNTWESVFFIDKYYRINQSYEGIDDNNFSFNFYINVFNEEKKMYNNAFFTSPANLSGIKATKQNTACVFMNPHPTKSPKGKNKAYPYAALDVIAHEYSHGITHFSSGLLGDPDNYPEQRSLNEAFSDIMGTRLEHFCQPKGNGFGKADWYIGEDEGPVFFDYSSSYPSVKYAIIRRLDDPTAFRVKWTHPSTGKSAYEVYFDHYSNYAKENPFLKILLGKSVTYPYGNSTIISHMYYLLSEGGVNKTSKKSVNGIGMDAATDVFFHAYTKFFWSKTNFIQAAFLIAWAGYDIYGLEGHFFDSACQAVSAVFTL